MQRCRVMKTIMVLWSLLFSLNAAGQEAVDSVSNVPTFWDRIHQVQQSV